MHYFANEHNIKWCNLTKKHTIEIIKYTHSLPIETCIKWRDYIAYEILPGAIVIFKGPDFFMGGACCICCTGCDAGCSSVSIGVSSLIGGIGLISFPLGTWNTASIRISRLEMWSYFCFFFCIHIQDTLFTTKVLT